MVQKRNCFETSRPELCWHCWIMHACRWQRPWLWCKRNWEGTSAVCTTHACLQLNHSLIIIGYWLLANEAVNHDKNELKREEKDVKCSPSFSLAKSYLYKSHCNICCMAWSDVCYTVSINLHISPLLCNLDLANLVSVEILNADLVLITRLWNQMKHAVDKTLLDSIWCVHFPDESSHC